MGWKTFKEHYGIDHKVIKHIDSERRICCKDGAGCIHFVDCICALPF